MISPLPEGALKVEPAAVLHRGGGRSLLWATEESPLFETRYGVSLC